MKPANTSYKRVYNPYAECCLGQIGFFAEIRSVGAETSHPQAKGEESLSHRTQKYIPVHLAEIRFQQKLDTRTSSRQGNRTDYKYQYNNEQSRHHDLGRFLDTFLHAFDNNKMSNQTETEPTTRPVATDCWKNCWKEEMNSVGVLPVKPFVRASYTYSSVHPATTE